MVRFVHTADWQLGMTRHFLDGEAQARFSQARIEAINKIGRLAEEQDCSFVVVCGDVFETNHVERQVIVRALDAMAETPRVAFYLLPGNHDPLNASSVFRSRTFVDHCPANVIVLEAEGPTEVYPDVQLVAAPWTSKAPLEDLVQRAIAPTSSGDGIRIAVGHGSVDVLSPDAVNPALIALKDAEAAIADGRIQYVALGDRHSMTSVGDTGRVWYPGAPEPTAFREVEPGYVLVVELGGDDISVEPHAVGRWTFHSLEADLRGADDIDRLETTLAEISDKPESIMQLSVIGQLSLAEKIRFDALLDHFSDLLASLSIWERHSELAVLPDDDDFASLGLSGFAHDALDDLVALAQGDGEDASAAMDALGLLYRLSGAAT